MIEAIFCVALAVYHEARGEGDLGQYHVASVVWNRTDSHAFANHPCGVIAEHKQFEFYPHFAEGHGEPTDQKAWKKSIRVAEETRNNRSTKAIFFAQPGIINPARQFLYKVGGHEFYYY